MLDIGDKMTVEEADDVIPSGVPGWEDLTRWEKSFLAGIGISPQMLNRMDREELHLLIYAHGDELRNSSEGIMLLRSFGLLREVMKGKGLDHSDRKEEKEKRKEAIKEREEAFMKAEIDRQQSEQAKSSVFEMVMSATGAIVEGDLTSIGARTGIADATLQGIAEKIHPKEEQVTRLAEAARGVSDTH